jgi:asparagine synthase (glutamine-hydrolysing)
MTALEKRSGMKGFVAVAGTGGELAERIQAMARAAGIAAGPEVMTEGVMAAWTSGYEAPQRGALRWARGAWGVCAVWGEPSLEMGRPADALAVAVHLEATLGTAGAAALRKVRGAFGAVAIAHGGEEVWLAVDRMGIERLCYAPAGQGLMIADRLQPLRAADVQARLDPQALYEYVFFHAVPAPRTMWRGHCQVPNGCAVQWRRGVAKTHRYWDMRFSEDARDAARLKDEFLGLLENVHRRYTGDGVATFLSGGTDSSTVCGMLGRASGKAPVSYSIGFEAEGYDETGYARTAAEHFGADHRVYYVTPSDVVSAIDIVAGYYDQPFGNASAVPVYWCARKAQEDGIRLLLAGDGGDELFGGNSRYGTQWQFSLYENIPGWIRRGLMEPVLGRLPHGIPVLSKAGSYVRQAQVPMPDRLHTYNLVNQLDAANIFEPEFLSIVDLQEPLRAQQAVYQSANAQSLVNRMLWLDFKYTLADSDLPKVSGMCEAAGVDVAYPLLADEIIEFSAKLAPELKLRGTQLRPFFKEALTGFLPQSTLTKSKHGFGLPFGLWLTTHAPLRDLAYSSLESLDRRGFLKEGFVTQLIERHRSGNAAYYGTLVWVLMMLERWFQQHGEGR